MPWFFDEKATSLESINDMMGNTQVGFAKYRGDSFIYANGIVAFGKHRDIIFHSVALFGKKDIKFCI